MEIGRKFVNNFKKTSEKNLIGGFGNYCCVPGCKSAICDKNRDKTNISLPTISLTLITLGFFL